MSTTPAATPASGLTDAEFHTRSQAVLDHLESLLDRWLEDDVVDIDGHRSGGLLEMKFPNGSVVVVNTQPPLHELWVAAQSGGYHFKYRDGAWRDTREGADFFELLSKAASQQSGVTLQFAPD
jgi:CyaY protein